MFRLVWRGVLLLLALSVIVGFARSVPTLLGAVAAWSFIGYLLWRAWPAVREDVRAGVGVVTRFLRVAAPGSHARRGGAETL